MTKTELKSIIRNTILESINDFPDDMTDTECEKCGDGVDMYKKSVSESTPPGFPEKLADKILKQYKDTPQKAYATMWSIDKKHGKKLQEMWAAWESKNQPVSEEASMAAGDLDAIEHYIGHLKQLVNDDSDLEDWVKAKLTLASSNLQSVFGYLNHAAKTNGQPGIECNECMQEVDQSLNEIVGVKPVVGQNKYNYVVTYTLQGTNQSVKSLAPIYASNEVDAKKIAVAPFNPNVVKIISVKVTNMGSVIQADVDVYNQSVQSTADSIKKFGTTN